MTDEERLGPPPIDPLSDAAWSRVERGLWSRMDAAAGGSPGAPRRWWLVVGPLAAAAAIAAIVVAIRGAAPEPIAGEPSRVVSGPGPSLVSFGDIHVELAPDTALVMSHEAGHPIAELERGAAWFVVAPRLQRPNVVVRSGDTTIRVIGTRFHVARSGEHSAVDVEHGTIEVQFRGRVATVGANQHWSSESPGQTSTLVVAAPVAPVAARTEPAQEAVGAGDPAPVANSRPRPASRTPGVEPRPRPERDIERAPDAANPAGDPDRTEYDRLAAIEAADPEAALAGYLALARTRGAWAAPSLFAAGRLAVDRRDDRARALLERYLQRFPGGGNATDARQLLARLARDARAGR